MGLQVTPLVPISLSLANICRVISPVAGAFAVFAVIAVVLVLDAVVVFAVTIGVVVLFPLRATTSTTLACGVLLKFRLTVAEPLLERALYHQDHS